ncbi:Glutamate receptor 1.4 [Labeo rohita]|uniref:Glutamate receptor 1.4 n=1 Tax=Labeo rohita TaxID=84645 RepID=A0ABQ8MCL0_LABRO|nr:Glutamate receptor 1.4 [Labeo rohita]
MGRSGESFSQPQQKSQMRVTVTGMIQAALFLPSSLWTITVAFLYMTNLLEKVDPNRFVTMTFCSMSSLGNLLCFGFSQSVFRNGIQKSQMRVTITGMVQAALFLPSSLWTVAVAFLYMTDLFELADPNGFVTMTFCSMSSLGNLLCFGFSQSVFRNGIASVINKLKSLR